MTATDQPRATAGLGVDVRQILNHPARLVAWLLSDEADWITGQAVASHGGWSAR
jgi:NAD(P)-dependent dehydrogenase (short-subunit alcohol dehydrogenase family)